MKFHSIAKIILFGGSDTLAECVEIILKKRLGKELIVVSSPRHLDERLAIFDGTLSSFLASRKVPTYNTNDINRFNLSDHLKHRVLGLAFGAPWIFSKETVKLFKPNHLLDFMVIDLPRYRGGAHYSWMILNEDQNLSLNLQIVSGGKQSFQKGPIIKRRSFKIPDTSLIPKDYFAFILSKEKQFISEFFDQINKKSSFELANINESNSSYFPFLSTKDEGYIDWNWTAHDVDLFIKAFDDPYPGASTFIKKRRYYLKKSSLQKVANKFHPFMAGVIIRKDDRGVYIAANGGLIFVGSILDHNGKNVTKKLALGDRFHTPLEKLNNAKQFKTIYDSRGLIRK